MAQKKLPIINKINSSMVWFTTFFSKYYKWLSSNQLYLIYIFNYYLLLLNFILKNTLWIKFETKYLYKVNKIKNKKRKYIKTKFFKYITSYIIEETSILIICNLYYKGSLDRFKKSVSNNWLKNNNNISIDIKLSKFLLV